jgi:glycosyltransferase involved in cell wall biosynthesis
MIRQTDRSPPTVVQIVLSLGRGGLETMAVDLAIGLERHGIRSVVVALDEGGVLETNLESASVEFAVLHGRRFKDPRFHLELAGHLRRFGASVVHTHMFAPLFHSLPAATLAGVRRIVHTEHSFEYLEPRPALRHMLRWMSRRTQAFTLVGERMLPYYANTVRVSAKRLHVIANGIDAGRYQPPTNAAHLRSELGIPNDVFVIGSAGRLAPEKNYQMLFRAAAECRARGTPVHVALFGEGSERAALASEARALGIDTAISFLGWRTDLHRALAALDVFVLTSESEGLPLALLEAMAIGLPSVSTPVGDIPRILEEGRTGFFVGTGDSVSLAARLQDLASDPAKRRSMGELARQVVIDRHSHDAMVGQYLSAYGLQ